MLFNSYVFLFVFFPVSLIAYFAAARFGEAWRLGAMLCASIVFYGAWDARFLLLLAGSILWNFSVGVGLTREIQRGGRFSTLLLAVGIAVDLVVLGVFKYAHFFLANYNALTGDNIVLGRIILPLGISFFTFEQIGYLVDIRRGRLYNADLLRFSVFVSFFPRLVAGPILRYSEILPQLCEEKQGRTPLEDIAVGLTIFIIGLAKKAILADGIAPFANSGFATSGMSIDFFAAWGAALSYTLQLYFDFSGYSDMAIGAARCFGVQFPMNFNSPYKSVSIIEFWRRWHMTLSRFLRDYLYIPLGGNRKGHIRRYINLFITMLLGGLWHGANWTFVAWGGLHGLYLAINHAWIGIRGGAREGARVGRVLATALTFVAVMIAWVFFRSENFAGALNLIAGLIGLHGATLPQSFAGMFHSMQPLLKALGVGFDGGSGNAMLQEWVWIAVLSAIAFFLPNTQQIMARFSPVLEMDQVEGMPTRWRWTPSTAWALGAGVLAFAAIASINRVSEFLYWQF